MIHGNLKREAPTAVLEEQWDWSSKSGRWSVIVSSARFGPGSRSHHHLCSRKNKTETHKNKPEKIKVRNYVLQFWCFEWSFLDSKLLNYEHVYLGIKGNANTLTMRIRMIEFINISSYVKISWR